MNIKLRLHPGFKRDLRSAPTAEDVLITRAHLDLAMQEAVNIFSRNTHIIENEAEAERIIGPWEIRVNESLASLYGIHGDRKEYARSHPDNKGGYLNAVASLPTKYVVTLRPLTDPPGMAAAVGVMRRGEDGHDFMEFI